jgi:hypothetical protein
MKAIVKCSGGLGAQLLAIAYCTWLSKNKNKKTTIQFTEQGVSHRHFVVADLLKNIDFQVIKSPEQLNSDGGILKEKLGSAYVHIGVRTRLKFRRFIKSGLQFTKVLIYRPNLSLEEISKVRVWTRFIDGYHADLRILKDVWTDLSRLIEEQRPQNFISNAGSAKTLSVHWRMGDYIESEANLTHGVIHPDEIVRQIQSVVDEYHIEKILIFSDSPLIAKSHLCEVDFGVNIAFIEGDIWDDMTEMAKSRFFIGSHSSISIFVAFAILDKNPDAVVCLPDKWFKRIPEGFESGIDNCHPKSIFPTIRTFDTKLL